MQPPICEVCDERFDPGGEGRLVRFVATDAGRAFEARGVPGHPPDQGWFCEHHVAEAAARASMLTSRAAVAEVRALGIDIKPAPDPELEQRRAKRPPSALDPDHPDPNGGAVERREPPVGPPALDLAAAARRDEMLRRMERRRATQVEHPLERRARRDSVAQRFRAAAERAVERLGLESVDADEARVQSSAASPEPRDAIGTTTITLEVSWSTDQHQVRWRDEDTRWDSWSGVKGGGDRMQGTIHLAIDDSWLFASYGSDGIVATVSESGERTSECSDIIDDLIDGLRSPS